MTDTAIIILALAGGLICGFILGLAAAFMLFRESKIQRQASIDAVIQNIEASFGKLSLNALSQSSGIVVELAKQELSQERQVGAAELNAKKGLIDQELVRIVSELDKVSNLVNRLEQDRAQKFGEVTSELKKTNDQTAVLAQITSTLSEALASTKKRGDWGERMAEDVLRLAGFVENVNYLKQRAIEGVGTKPDFTFLLPKSLKLNMDVKFPLDNYLKYLKANSELEKDKFLNDFLRDVKSRIKEVTTREYINPEQNTVDTVLLFIPNEQIYAFIHEQDSSILDDGIKNKVVFCSPITLFAVLAVIRQAVDNFSIQQASNEILSLLSAFNKQWYEFVKKLGVLGDLISDAMKEYETLATTRRRQLEKPLRKIEDLRTQRGLPIAAEDDKSIPTTGENEG